MQENKKFAPSLSGVNRGQLRMSGFGCCSIDAASPSREPSERAVFVTDIPAGAPDCALQYCNRLVIGGAIHGIGRCILAAVGERVACGVLVSRLCAIDYLPHHR